MKFRRLPPDLAAILGFTLLTLGVVLLPGLRETPLRLVVGIPFVLFVPGYVLVSVLYPAAYESKAAAIDGGAEDTGITSLERTALSFVFSMAIVALVGFILNSTPVGLRLVPVLVSLAGVILSLTIVAGFRRQKLAPGTRFNVPWRTKVRTIQAEVFKPDSLGEAAVNLLLVLSLFLAVSSVGYVLITPTDGETFTEFYILTEDQEATVEEYPTEFVVGEPQSLVVAIENQEHRTMDYTVIVELQRVQAQDDATQVITSNRLRTFETRLEHNETWQRTHTVTPQITGDRLRLTYLLYRGDPPASPTAENAYRKLQLVVNVTTTN